MKKIAQGIVRFRKLILTVAFLLLIPSAIGAIATRINMTSSPTCRRIWTP
jgi:hypothetical protein